jgi:tetratricopeptide (TPR) repeat protein
MSEESKSNAPDAPTPLGEIEHGPSKFEQFMEKNLKLVILFALLIIVGVAAFVITSQLGEAKDREAGNALLAAESPEDLRKVSADYADSGAASSAQLLLAGQLFEEGKEDEAIETLKALTGSEHPAAAQAQFSLAGLLLKKGQTEEAKASYEAILADSEATYLHPLSLIALGDIAEAAGDTEKAKEYYQRKLDDYQAYGIQSLAVTRLNLAGVDQPQNVPPPPAPEPAANPNAGVSSTFTNPLPNLGAPTPVPAMPNTQPEPAIEITPDVSPAEDTAGAEGENAGEADSEEGSVVGETPTFEAPVAEEE